MLIFFAVFCNTVVSAATISVDTSGNINNWMLQSGQTNTDSSLYLTVLADTNPWYVYVRDALNYDKPTSSAGYMTEWYGSAYVASPHILNSKMNIAASAGSGYVAEGTISLSNSDQKIVSGSRTGSSVNIPIVVTQQVTAADANLTAGSGHKYQIITTYSGGFT